MDKMNMKVIIKAVIPKHYARDLIAARIDMRNYPYRMPSLSEIMPPNKDKPFKAEPGILVKETVLGSAFKRAQIQKEVKDFLNKRK